MSRSIDLFIMCPKPIEELASDVAQVTGMELKPGGVPGTWSVDEEQVHAELRTHPYVDDGELVLERYQYALSSRVPNDTRLTTSAEAAFLRLVSEALHKAGIASLLVHDLQYRDRVDRSAGGDESATPTDAS